MIDIQRIFKDYRINYSVDGPNCSPGRINTKCVFCSDDSDHLGWPLDGTHTHCWRCGGHEIIASLSRLLRVRRQEAERIAEDYESNSILRSRLNKDRDGPRPTSLQLPGSDLNKYHRKYLKKRNFDPDYIIKQYKIQGTGPLERWNKIDFSSRIIIPIYQGGQLISFQARDITGKTDLRYKGCPLQYSVKDYKHTLYNLDSVYPLTDALLVVVEGIMDVWRMGPGFVASFGTSLTDYQIRVLAAYDHVMFLFDPEPDAQRKAQTYAERLASLGRQAEVLQMEAGKDPGDLDEAEAGYLRRWLGMKQEVYA